MSKVIMGAVASALGETGHCAVGNCYFGWVAPDNGGDDPVPESQDSPIPGPSPAVASPSAETPQETPESSPAASSPSSESLQELQCSSPALVSPPSDSAYETSGDTLPSMESTSRLGLANICSDNKSKDPSSMLVKPSSRAKYCTVEEAFGKKDDEKLVDKPIRIVKVETPIGSGEYKDIPVYGAI